MMRRIAWFAALVLMTLTVLVLLWQFRDVVALFLLSLAVAAALRPPIEYLAAHRVPRTLAILGAYLSVLVVLGGLLYAASGPFVAELQRGSDAFAIGYERIRALWPSGGTLQRLVAERLPPLDQFYRSISGGQGLETAQTVLGFTLSLFDVVSKAALTLVLSIYWGADRVHFERLWLSILPAEQRMRAREIWRSTEAGVGAYVRSEVLQSLFAGILLWLGYWGMGLHFPVLLALFGALVWLVPLVGGALALAPVVLVALSAGLPAAIGAALYTAVVFVVLEWLVEPRFFNRRRYNSILVVIVMIAMANAMGLVGLLLAPPLAAAIQIVFGALAAGPSAQTPAEAVPQVAQLRARLAGVRAWLDRQDGEAAPEALSLVSRLERLVDEAEATLNGPGQDLSATVPQDSLGRLAVAAEK